MNRTSADPGIPGSIVIDTDEDHLSIAKPSSERSPVYAGTRRFLIDIITGLTATQTSGHTDAPLGFAGGPRTSYAAEVTSREVQHVELLDRDRELDELATLATQDGYLVIQGGAWTGKTALMTHLARRLRAEGAGVIEFFVVERSADTGSRFLSVANTQLLEFLDEPGGIAATVDEQAQQFNRLWDAAVAATADTGQRLVLCVDALDEQNRDPDERISSRLPVYCGKGCAVVVTTRVEPPFRHTVDAFHGLATVPDERVYQLTPSPHARTNQEQAEQAIRRCLEVDDTRPKDVIGFLTYGRGPLSKSELAELIDVLPGEINPVLDPLIRHLRPRQDRDRQERYELGHVELERQARTWFGPRREHHYTDRLLVWGDQYADQQWPRETPGYLVETLDALTRHATWRPDQLDRLVALTSDQRANLLRRLHGHTQPLLASLDTAYTLAINQTPPHRLLAFRLAVLEHEQRSRSNAIPLPVILALTIAGQPDRALEVARSITDDNWRAEALSGVASQMAATDPDRAVEVARSITDDYRRAVALSGVASQLAAINPDRALTWSTRRWRWLAASPTTTGGQRR